MKNLVVLCTDPGFFVPSLVVANQVNQQNLNPAPEIVIYLNEFTPEQLETTKFLQDELQIKLVPVEPDLLDIGHAFDEHFQKGISSTALMRLALSELIPNSYDAITYLDGDMQIVGDLTEFLMTAPPEDQILAAPEAYPILKWKGGVTAPWLVKYLADLGMSDPDQYFNSGMLRFKPSLWKPIANQALDFFRDNAAICPNYDQSALNAVLDGNWARAHPAYNWHSFFNKLAYPVPFAKKIVHFTSRPKPWVGAHEGWHPSFYEPYRTLVDRFPVLSEYIRLGAKPTMVDELRYFKDRMKAAAIKKRYRGWMKDYLQRTEFFIEA